MMGGSPFDLQRPNDPGAFSRGWALRFQGKGASFFIRHRVKGADGKKLRDGHPPWYMTGSVGTRPESRRIEIWYWSLEAALAAAQAEIGFAGLRVLEG